MSETSVSGAVASLQSDCSCGELVIQLLADRGVEVVFGIPGVHTLELYRGLGRSEIAHITPRHEQGAAFMADGYARISGRPGVCLLITGAGVTNAATAIASAYHDSQPLLIISSTTATYELGKGSGALHDLPDQQQFMSTITTSSETVLTPEQLPTAVARAFALLEGPRTRPVHVGIPVDILTAPANSFVPTADHMSLERPSPAPRDLDRAVDFLRAARDPIIVLGGGGIDAGEEALRVSAAIGAPIATTINGKGAIPEKHPAALGATLTLEPVYGAVQAADVLLAVGTEFSGVDYYYQGGTPALRGELIRVDSDPDQMIRQRRPTVALVGDAAETLRELALRLERPRRDRGALAAKRAADLRRRLQWWPGAQRLFPVLDAISGALPEDAIIAADSTQLAYVANSYISIQQARSYLCPNGYGTLGPALPMAIGAKVAAPHRPVACLIGDGGLLFTVAELATAATLELPLAILVWQNHGYGEIRDAMDQASVSHVGTEATAQDYIKIAEGFGCNAMRVRSLTQVTTAIQTAFASKLPTVIELPADLAKVAP